METGFFLNGIAVGFAIAAPVGPIGTLCIRRSLEGGFPAGLAIGLGAALADALYGVIAAFGLMALTDFLVLWHDTLKLSGGIFLILLGVRSILVVGDPGPPRERPLRAAGLAGDVATSFALTVTNPVTILSFVAIFAGMGLMHAGGEPSQSMALVLGVFSGSLLWWLILSGGVGGLRRHIPRAALPWINRFAGALLIGFGAAAITN